MNSLPSFDLHLLSKVVLTSFSSEKISLAFLKFGLKKTNYLQLASTTIAYFNIKMLIQE